MSSVVLLIGPSGVGKSTLSGEASRHLPDFHFHNLDGLISRAKNMDVVRVWKKYGDDGFLDLCRREVDRLTHSVPMAFHVVDVGAGGLFSPARATEWLRDHTTVALIDSAEQVWARAERKGCFRNKAHFLESEYSAARCQIYTSANYILQLDGLAIPDAANRLVACLRSVSGQQAQVPNGKGRRG